MKLRIKETIGLDGDKRFTPQHLLISIAGGFPFISLAEHWVDIPSSGNKSIEGARQFLEAYEIAHQPPKYHPFP